MRSIKRVQDIAFGSVIIFIALTFLTQAGRLPKKSSQFPSLILYLMIFSGAGLILSTLFSQYRNNRKKESDGNNRTGTQPHDEEQPYISTRMFIMELLIPGIILIFSTMLIRVLGFYICTAIVVLSIFLFQGFSNNRKNSISRRVLFEGLVFAIGTSAVMYVFFGVLLAVPTPQGIFGF